mgnify:CR=1 FL=1
MTADEIRADLQARQITDSDDMIGKTIEWVGTAEREWDYEPMHILFTDRTWVILRALRGYDGDAGVVINTDPPDRENAAFALTSDECTILDRDAEAQRRATLERRRIADEAERRREYEKLKAEFEGSDTTVSGTPQ